MHDNDAAIEVPIDELSEAALYGLVEAFVLREGTDYGERTFSLAEKVQHVLAQLEGGEAVIVFDGRGAGVDIRPRHERK